MIASKKLAQTMNHFLYIEFKILTMTLEIMLPIIIGIITLKLIEGRI